MKEFTYLAAQQELENIRCKSIDFIRKCISEKYNGHHVLDGTERFCESPYEDDSEWEVVEIKVDDDGSVYYLHDDTYGDDDDYDWHDINSMPIEDIVYVTSFYK